MRFNWRRQYISDDWKTGDFLEVLPSVLTLTPQNWYGISQPVGMRDTMFKEVKLKQYTKSLYIKTAIEWIYNAKPYNDITWRNKVYNRLISIVDQSWDRSKFHVIAHSSGIDSRILSSIIKVLGFNNLLFVECAGEADLFERIMKAQGWERSKYMVYRASQPPGQYFEHSFNIVPDNFNGPVGYPVNHFYDPYDELIREDVIPEDSQFFGAFGCYFEKALTAPDPAAFFHADYFYQMNAFRQRGQWIFPWWDILYLKEIVKYKGCYENRRISDCLNEILPEKVRTIPKYRTSDMIRRGWRTISGDLLRRLQQKFNKTVYAKKKNVKLNPQIAYSTAWGQYQEAMICEKLIKEGYVIT